MVATLTVLSSLAVERWGMIAFVLILVAMVVASFGLATTEWLRRRAENTWLLLAILFAFVTSSMLQALGVSVWGTLLIGNFIVLAVWLVTSRGLPRWQSRRGG
jgi:ABC-type multidrug transport system permease subunit